MSKRKIGTLLAGIGIGVGLGILFAPKSGEETRKELKEKMDDLIQKLKDIDYSEVRDNLIQKVKDIREELKDLDREKAIEIAKIKAEQIRNKVEELYKEAVKRGKPVVEKAAKDVKEKTVEVLKIMVDKLEAEPKQTKKVTRKKTA